MKIIPLIFLFLWSAPAVPASDESVVLGNRGELEAQGLVTPYREIKLAVESDGVVTETSVQEGDRVEAGQILGRLDDRRAVLAERVAGSVAEKRRADLVSLRKLFDSKVASRNDLEKAQVEADSAAADLEAARLELEKRRISSPVSGFVLRRLKDPGESIQRLETFAEIIDMSKVSVILYLPAEHIHRVQAGQRASVYIPLVREQPFAGVVEMVDPVVDPGAGIFRAKIVVPNEDGKIISGTRSRVVIEPPSAS